MRAYILAATGMLALAGCQSADEKQAAATGEFRLTNATMEDVTRLTKAARAKTLMQPGLWHTEMRIISADLSAYPEGPKRDAQLEAIKGQERSSTGCRTADTLKPFDIDNLEQLAGTCTFPRYIQAGGKVDIEMHCGEGANQTVMLGTGTLSRTGYDVTLRQTTATPGAPNYLGLAIAAKGSRTGNCVANNPG